MAKVSFIKFGADAIGSQVHTGGIATAVIVSHPYVNEYNETCVDVIWDNDWQLRPFPALVMYAHFRSDEKYEFIDNYLRIYELDPLSEKWTEYPNEEWWDDHIEASNKLL